VWCHTCPLPLVQDRLARAWLGWKNTSPPGSTPCHALAQVHGITICQANRSAASWAVKSICKANRSVSPLRYRGYLAARFAKQIVTAGWVACPKSIGQTFAGSAPANDPLPQPGLHSAQCSSPAIPTTLRSSLPCHRKEHPAHHARTRSRTSASARTGALRPRIARTVDRSPGGRLVDQTGSRFARFALQIESSKSF